MVLSTKTAFISLLLFFPIFAFSSPAPTEVQKVRAEIEKQANDPNSNLNKQINTLITVNKLPPGTFLQLAGIDLLQKGNQQTHHACSNGPCLFYERNFYRQISDVRWRSKDGTQLKAWVIGIYVSVFRAWDSDNAGNKINLRTEDIHIDTVIFL